MRVRRPRVDLDCRGEVALHGWHDPVRGIWHDTEGHDLKGIRDLQGVVDFWGNQGRGYGAHLIIDAEGLSALCANPSEITWHTGQRNTGSIGVELIGWASFTQKLWIGRAKQLDKLARWMAWFNLEHDIPIRFNVNRGWSGHRDQPHQTHTDPGRFFPRSFVLSRAAKYRREGW